MSAIAGYVRWDDAPVDAELLKAMAGALIHRGPDRQAQWCNGSVGFVHCLLQTTSESFTEPLPYATADLVITADARVDNRQSLITRLGAPPDIPDSKLILETYRRWGPACVEHLVGDFAFAIWDQQQQHIFAARDPLGVKPFNYYMCSTTCFAFASEIKALKVLPDVPQRINDFAIADFLLKRFHHRTYTFYQDVWRLEPGHLMIVSRSNLRTYQYWKPDPARTIRYASDEDYAAHFREIFTEAVRCRLRSSSSAGVLLSGGLDSASIAGTIREICGPQQDAFSSFSAVFPNVPRSDERLYIEDVVAQGRIKPFFFHADQKGTLPDIERLFWHLETPFATPNLFLTWELCQIASQCGVRVMLDGLDGDTAVSHGFGYLAELAFQGRWSDLKSEIDDLAQQWKPNAHRSFFYRSYVFPILTLYTRQLRWSALLETVQQISTISNVSQTQLITTYILRPLIPQSMRIMWSTLRKRNSVSPQILNPVFARRMTAYLLQHDIAQLGKYPPRNDYDVHARNIQDGLIPLALEKADRTAAAFQIELRHPFFDQRLVEYCLALPGDQKLRHGWSRFILRRAMGDRLPPAIQQRSDKTNLGFNFAHVFLTYERALIDSVLADPVAIEPYVNLDFFQNLYHKTINNTTSNPTDVMIIWLVVVLNIWLKQEYKQ